MAETQHTACACWWRIPCADMPGSWKEVKQIPKNLRKQLFLLYAGVTGLCVRRHMHVACLSGEQASRTGSEVTKAPSLAPVVS